MRAERIFQGGTAYTALSCEACLHTWTTVDKAEPRTEPAMTPLDVVREWTLAVNVADVPGVMARSTGDVQLGGPRGFTRGQPKLREWVERTRLHFETRRTFASGDRVVLFGRAIWRDQGGLTIAEADMATRFIVAGGRVGVVVRHDDLDEALAAAELTAADEVRAP